MSINYVKRDIEALKRMAEREQETVNDFESQYKIRERGIALVEAIEKMIAAKKGDDLENAKYEFVKAFID